MQVKHKCIYIYINSNMCQLGLLTITTEKYNNYINTNLNKLTIKTINISSVDFFLQIFM